MIASSTLTLFARKSGQRAFSAANKNTALDPRHSKIIVLGAGFSGLVASSYIPKISNVKNFEIRMFDPTVNHIYTPNLDLLPYDIKTLDQIEKPVFQLTNNAINLEFSSIASINPANNTVVTKDNREYSYDYLVLATGLKPRLDKVEGLQEALQERDDGVVSTSSVEGILKYKRKLDSLIAGDIIFYSDERTKSFGSALNQALLTDTFLRENRGPGLRNMSRLQYVTSRRTLFPSVKYSIRIQELLKNKNIEYDNYGLKLVEVDAKSKTALFRNLDSDKKVEKKYEILLVNPEYELPEALQTLADSNGDLNIHPQNLIHEQYSNILALGHCTRSNNFIPSRRSTLEQGVILAYNLRTILDSAANAKGNVAERLVRYSGVTEVPLFVDSRSILPVRIDPKLPDLVTKPSTVDYYKEVHILPETYFRLLSKGLWFENTGLRVPQLSTL